MTVDRRMIELYNEYVHTALPRREFIARLTRMAGGAAAAMTALAVLEPNYVQARQVEPDDKRLKCERITFNGPDGPVKAYTAMPRKIGRRDKLAGVLVIHENRGLNEHIEDVARRTALAGYIAIAPDGLSVAGGAPADQEAARDLFAKTDGARIASDVLAAVPWLAADPINNGRIGVVGFCYGGGLALRAAVETVGVDCAVSFYGRPPPNEEARKIKVPLLLHYAGTDERINAGIPDFKAALDDAHVPYTIHMYPDTQHGFHNDSSEARYNEAAAKLAWQRTLDFFAQYLKPSV
ncbi:MAG TPA: dienelactone hydrolase family protein [Steroidobacteraceae bacterium]|jgi:carboxymethylenebutenolidase|nr:dienelactone hydrolase family protein [Steroidobacteraceae bacterium]